MSRFIILNISYFALHYKNYRMMKILKLYILIIIINSCANITNKQEDIKSNKTENTTFNIEKILTEYMNAWAEHDKNKIETFYAENVEWYDLPSDYTTKGKEQVGKAITDAFLNNVKNMYWVKSGDSFISGNTITYEWIYGGVFSGNWGDLKIENKKFEIKGISTTSINEKGKLIFQKDYYDFLSYQKQLGIIK